MSPPSRCRGIELCVAVSSICLCTAAPPRFPLPALLLVHLGDQLSYMFLYIFFCAPVSIYRWVSQW